MHKTLSQSKEYDISWISGSQCLLVAVRDGVHGFRGVSQFFSSLREARCTENAASWLLDLRQARKIPDELWTWVDASWFPQVVGEGLRRQALVLPEAAAGRAQWRSLKVASLENQVFTSVPRAIMWLGTDFGRPPERQRRTASRKLQARI